MADRAGNRHETDRHDSAREVVAVMVESDGGFALGARVERPVNIYAPSSLVRVGTVTALYSEDSEFGHYDELYEVVWDTEGGEPIEPMTCRGYFRHGMSLSWKQR